MQQYAAFYLGFHCLQCTDLGVSRVKYQKAGKLPLCGLLIFFSKSIFLENSFGNTIRVSNSLDPDQAKHFVN